jgi:hypothetical protein
MPSGEELEFTYNLGDNMKIDIEKAKLKKAEIEAQRKKNSKNLRIRWVNRISRLILKDPQSLPMVKPFLLRHHPPIK